MGLSPPKAVTEAPRMEDRFRDFWEVYVELSNCRGQGFGPEPITPADFLAWCQLHSVEAWYRRMLWRVVRRVDAAHLEMMREARNDNAAART